jgi:hypothetical protein
MIILRARLAQLQLLILSEDLEEPCQTGIFFKLILVWSRKIGSRFFEEKLHPPLKQLLNQPNMDLPLKFDGNYPQLPLDKNITTQFMD